MNVQEDCGRINKITLSFNRLRDIINLSMKNCAGRG